MSRRKDDIQFMAGIRAEARRRPRKGASVLLFTIAALFVATGAWANWATVDEVTTGTGRVVPTRQIQVVQNLEGGIVAEILVLEGDVVAEGDVLVRISDASSRASAGENRARYDALRAKIQRLKAEVSGKDPVFSNALRNVANSVVSQEIAHYQARQSELLTAIQVFVRQRVQRVQELKEFKSRVGQLERGLVLSKEEIGILRPMVKAGVTARVELLRLERQINELEGTLEVTRIAIPRAEAAVAEVDIRIQERRAAFRSSAQSELNESLLRLTILEKALTAVDDRVSRSEVRAPVRGIVNRVMVSTIGGVITPGMDLVEMVPLEDTLIIEAAIRPADIAFLRPGQNARVKLTAYAFETFGALDAQLDQIGANTIVGENGESYYPIRLRTDQTFLGTDDEPLPIIPGMVAQVDILTGKRTILSYFLKPVLQARERALRER
jgi:adhesin transport system membrane fusion protein